MLLNLLPMQENMTAYSLWLLACISPSVFKDIYLQILSRDLGREMDPYLDAHLQIAFVHV